MGANIWFWLIYVIIGLFGGFGLYRGANSPYGYYGGYFVLFVLIGILCLHDFGSPIR